MAKTKYIVLDKEFEIQKIFNTRKSATRYAETHVKYQPQIIASIKILKKMVK